MDIVKEKMYIRFESTIILSERFAKRNMLDSLRTIMLSGAVDSCLQQEKLVHLCI